MQRWARRSPSARSRSGHTWSTRSARRATSSSPVSAATARASAWSAGVAMSGRTYRSPAPSVAADRRRLLAALGFGRIAVGGDGEPHVAHALTGDVARLAVGGVEVERLAVVGDL